MADTSGPLSDLTGIDLADAIAAVRDQLADAAARAADETVVFDVGPIEMEFTMELRRETRANGKIKAWVVEAGADAARITGRTHRLAFTLTPRDARTNAPWQVGNDERGSTAAFGRTPSARPRVPGPHTPR